MAFRRHHILVIAPWLLLLSCRKNVEAETDSLKKKINIIGQYVGVSHYYDFEWKPSIYDSIVIDTFFVDTIVVAFVTADTILIVQSNSIRKFKYNSSNKYVYSYHQSYYGTVWNADFKPPNDSLIIDDYYKLGDFYNLASMYSRGESSFRGEKL